MLRGRQTRDLVAWARENGRLIPSAIPTATDHGQEHRVWLGTDGTRVFKATHPGSSGFVVLALPETGGQPELIAALPLEYIERLLLQNQLFGDDLKLEGVAEEPAGVSIVTSQPLLVGVAPSPAEITAFMQRLRFQPLPGLRLGHPGALAFYRDLDEVAVFDAHVANFVKDTAGTVLPIDLILVRADAELQRALQPWLGYE